MVAVSTGAAVGGLPVTFPGLTLAMIYVWEEDQLRVSRRATSTKQRPLLRPGRSRWNVAVHCTRCGRAGLLVSWRALNWSCRIILPGGKGRAPLAVGLLFLFLKSCGSSRWTLCVGAGVHGEWSSIVLARAATGCTRAQTLFSHLRSRASCCLLHFSIFLSCNHGLRDLSRLHARST